MEPDIPESLSDDDMIPDSLSLTREQEERAATGKFLDTFQEAVDIVGRMGDTMASVANTFQRINDKLDTAIQEQEIEELNRLLK